MLSVRLRVNNTFFVCAATHVVGRVAVYRSHPTPSDDVCAAGDVFTGKIDSELRYVSRGFTSPGETRRHFVVGRHVTLSLSATLRKTVAAIVVTVS